MSTVLVSAVWLQEVLDVIVCFEVKQSNWQYKSTSFIITVSQCTDMIFLAIPHIKYNNNILNHNQYILYGHNVKVKSKKKSRNLSNLFNLNHFKLNFFK